MTMSYESKLKKDIIPANYFCKYHIDLDSKIKWQLKNYRYISVLFMEKLEVVLTSISAPFGTSRGNRNSVMFDDDYLRSKSYMYSSGNRNYTSHMTLQIPEAARSVDIYARNMVKITGNTWKMVLEEKTGGFSF